MAFAKAPLPTPSNDPINDPEPTLGILGRLGAWSVAHKRRVFLTWLLIVVVLGIFAPNVEKALSGAGWQADGSQSVAVRTLAQKDFGGQASSAIEVVANSAPPLSSPREAATVLSVEKMLKANPDISEVVSPVPGISISANDKTAIVLGGAAADPNTMVRVADALKA